MVLSGEEEVGAPGTYNTRSNSSSTTRPTCSTASSGRSGSGFSPKTGSTGCRPIPPTPPGTARPRSSPRTRTSCACAWGACSIPTPGRSARSGARTMWFPTSSSKTIPNGDVIARSRFHMMELRRDDVRHFAGSYFHHLSKNKDRLSHQAAARGHDQRAGGLRLRPSGLGVKPLPMQARSGVRRRTEERRTAVVKPSHGWPHSCGSIERG